MSFYKTPGRTPWFSRTFLYQRLFAVPPPLCVERDYNDAEAERTDRPDICEFESSQPSHGVRSLWATCDRPENEKATRASAQGTRAVIRRITALYQEQQSPLGDVMQVR
jgi:hypothetical protein